MSSGTVEANGISLAYETFGAPDRPAILLVMGIGAQMVGWHEDFCEALAVAHHVVRFDNRDVGETQWLEGSPDLAACAAGDTSSAPYSLEDMADDAIALLDALGIGPAHVVGASMGGMIAQTLAIRHPERVLSLTSIMSTTGEPGIARPTEAAVQILLSPPARTRDQAMEPAVAARRVLGFPAGAAPSRRDGGAVRAAARDRLAGFPAGRAGDRGGSRRRGRGRGDPG